jgi:hypothetical protein
MERRLQLNPRYQAYGISLHLSVGFFPGKTYIQAPHPRPCSSMEIKQLNHVGRPVRMRFRREDMRSRVEK